MYYLCLTMLADKLKNIFASTQFNAAVAAAIAANEWFSERDIAYAIDAIESEFLDAGKLSDFLSVHPMPRQKKHIGIVCAGNIPLVGFGDMFYGLLAGHRVTIKPSGRDILMRYFSPLVGIAERLEDLADADEIWIMGSDATCDLVRAMYPHKRVLARASRHSVAILDGTESAAEISALTYDIFLYCGMGCRSVSHLYIPSGFDLSRLQFEPRPMPAAWGDSYRYQKAVRAMRGEDFIDCGMYILAPAGDGGDGGDSGAGVVTYSFYDSAPFIDTFGNNISPQIDIFGNNSSPQIDTSHIQCIVGHDFIDFGRAQRPTLSDFANGINPLDA